MTMHLHHGGTLYVGHSDLEVFGSPLNAVLWAMETLPGFGEACGAIGDLT